MKRILTTALVVLFALQLSAQKTPGSLTEKTFPEGFWVEKNDLDRLKRGDTEDPHPYDFTHGFCFTTETKDGQPHLYDCSYEWDCDMVYEKGAWRLANCPQGKSQEGQWDLKFYTHGDETYAGVRSIPYGQMMPTTTLFQLVPSNPDPQKGEHLSDRFWAYTQFVLAGTYTATSGDGNVLEDIKLSETLEIEGFNERVIYFLSLCASQPLIRFADEEWNFEYHVLEGNKSGFKLYFPKETKDDYPCETIVEKGELSWTFERQ